MPSKGLKDPTKNPGGREAWATPEQKDYLESMLPEYARSRLKKSRPKFWALIFEHWEATWTMPEAIQNLTPEDKCPRIHLISVRESDSCIYGL